MIASLRLKLSPNHDSSTTFSLGPLVREIGSDHILHGDAHGLIYGDLDIAEVVGSAVSQGGKDGSLLLNFC